MASSKSISDGMANFGRKLARELRGAVQTGFKGRPDPSEEQPLAGAIQDIARAMNASGQMLSPEQVHAFLSQRARPLHPFDKRRVLHHMEGVPQDLELGWVQYPDSRGACFSLGIFTSKTHFAQIALADDRGRVFVGEKADMDTLGLEPVFMFGKERTVHIPYGRRFGKESDGQAASAVDAIQGGIIGKDDTGHMSWLASWLKRDNRYTLEQMRPHLPSDMRYDLEYRDAISIAFFSAYMLPRIAGRLMGFGAGNIFRRLNREAPMGAIRRSVSDSLQAHAEGMRTSGLEDYFGDLMREAGALDPIPGLEAVHGAEPMHLYASSYSGAYVFSWDSGMDMSAALRALRIEGNLNRFASVSSWLERNARLGAYPTEDTVNRVQAAQLDQALLDNPAISALQMEEDFPLDFDPVEGDGRQAAVLLVDKARTMATSVASENPNPVEESQSRFASKNQGSSEWLYRKTFSTLLRSLRLPFRFDVDFRSHVSEGQVAIAFTSAGRSMMPSSRFESSRNGWVDLSESERSQMSADYNLRVGMMMAALAFGVDDSVSQVSLHIDSLGLEEAQAQQDSAISEMMAQALAAFERARTGGGAVTGSKGDPKDGDIHGDPNHLMTRDSAPGVVNQGAEAPQSGAPSAAETRQGETEATYSTQSEPQGPVDPDDAQAVNQEFADLMQGIDLDSMTFASPADSQDSVDGLDQDSDNLGEFGEQKDGDPLSALRRNPTVRNLVTVTFTRELFLAQLRQHGLEDPKSFYRFFDASMDVDSEGGLEPVSAEFDMRDGRFAPRGSQDEPELEDLEFSQPIAQIVGAEHVTGLSIQRADLLERAMADFRRLSDSQDLGAAAKAHEAMNVVTRIGDPELSELAPQVTSALIDTKAMPDLHFALSDQLDSERVKARDLLFSGEVGAALQLESEAVAKVDALFASSNDTHSVPRYFNSYAERVVYNRLFAIPGERTLLIPDNLFYAHLELSDLLTQFKQGTQALQHLNTMVAYAPAYPLSHLKLAVQLARNEDWTGARAATLNALNVALDRSDAAFAYYRFAYAAWMRDEFAVAAAAYLMAEHISPGRISALRSEFEELAARADSQCIPIPRDYDDARLVLQEEGLPVWPHTKVATIVRQAARVLVDAGQFVPARTLSVAAARMNDEESDGLDMVEVQFLQSLSA
ncbi:hypothetical protein KIMH_10060 [Bombiscardovia apis]|uniref:Tetratricopeptide repeat protein n=1 Tax=Bombiscardovia apis TaxID=2932182 RepID=A0ABM8BDS2_9BIFI|nr:tetratricopeptide repeat protein [Bombiscardovia apis]BDR54895.1 hypothetical protein KIMH_10060 [Bombiscardovia apis]